MIVPDKKVFVSVEKISYSFFPRDWLDSEDETNKEKDRETEK